MNQPSHSFKPTSNGAIPEENGENKFDWCRNQTLGSLSFANQQTENNWIKNFWWSCLKFDEAKYYNSITRQSGIVHKDKAMRQLEALELWEIAVGGEERDDWMKWNRDWIACLVWFSRKSVLAQWIPAIKLKQAAIPIRFQSFRAISSNQTSNFFCRLPSFKLNLLSFIAWEWKESKIDLMAAEKRSLLQEIQLVFFWICGHSFILSFNPNPNDAEFGFPQSSFILSACGISFMKLVEEN